MHKIMRETGQKLVNF